MIVACDEPVVPKTNQKGIRLKKNIIHIPYFAFSKRAQYLFQQSPDA